MQKYKNDISIVVNRYKLKIVNSHKVLALSPYYVRTVSVMCPFLYADGKISSRLLSSRWSVRREATTFQVALVTVEPRHQIRQQTLKHFLHLAHSYITHPQCRSKGNISGGGGHASAGGASR